MQEIKWVRCPVCGNKTRLQIRTDTVLKNFLLYCPKCRQESLVDVKNLRVTPDAQTQSRHTCEESQFAGSLYVQESYFY